VLVALLVECSIRNAYWVVVCAVWVTVLVVCVVTATSWCVAC
jgi:hypothetical protein